MTTLTEPTPARKPRLPQWLKRLLWLSLLLVVLVAGFCSLWVYHFVLGGTFSSAELVESIPCGSGEYRLLVYAHENGDGYFKLVDRNGKVFGKAKFTEGTGVSAHWHDDCLAANVPSDDGIVILEVPQPGPSRFDTPPPQSNRP